MMTLEQIKICQRLGLDCDWILQNYSEEEDFENKIAKQLAPKYKTETSNNKAKVRTALQYNIKLYLSALVKEGLKTKNPYILWYGLWEEEQWDGKENPITQQDYINIPNATISNMYSAGDLGYEVYLNCPYINKTGHYFSIECDKLCRPIRHSIEG